MFFEVKNEATTFEVMIKRILEEVGNLVNEVLCLKLVDSEVTSIEAKGHEYNIVEEKGMILEEKGIEDKIVEEMGMTMTITKGLKLINKALGEEMTRGQVGLWRCWGKPPRSSVCC